MDTIRISVDFSRIPTGETLIFVNERNLIDLVREVEQPFALREGSPGKAGAYMGLSPWETLLPSRHLLGEPERQYNLKRGRIAILACGDCGEVDCWPLVAKITMRPDVVIWSEFEQPHRGSGSPIEQWRYDGLKRFVFARNQYERELGKSLPSRKPR